MEKVSVETTHNVRIDYPLASVGDRIIALLIDLIILVSYGILLTYLIGLLSLPTSGAAFVIYYLPVFLYQLLCEIFLEGQSLGKKLVKIRVVRLDGGAAGVSNYLLRWLLYPVDLLFFGVAAILTILLSGRGQRLGDLAAGTTVIRLKRPAQTFEHPSLANLPADYAPYFPEVVRLDDHDIELVQEVLLAYRRQQQSGPVYALVQRLTETLQTDMKGMNPVEFLKTIVRDYHFIATRPAATQNTTSTGTWG
ncbi:Uncharacterized membrane protein YckC, RDD family [Catalinimonas alkaloidigena]|uniref:Uncharacterized membrane protein YckC, RDD family n=1 Tax=Catalinimonas alkaloidigena TaxID=1075417 RepID=A0A1G9IPN2_9BACT|nr:RDD family protein [Catalinimonas alkaloidigena]SDL26903.1 Uncharacterized membrane protein YckC, RDD family [Catalinimonas alkaloidigena]